MPDPTPDAIKPREAVMFAQKEVRARTLSPEMAAAKARADALRARREKGESAEAIFRSETGASRQRFSTTDRDALLGHFGAGEAKIKTDGTIEGTGLAAENLKGAKEAIAKVATVLQYTDIQKQALLAGKDIATFVREKGIGDWSNIRKNALDYLLNEGGLGAKFPEIRTLGHDFLEQAIGSDPKLSEFITAKMNAALAKAEALPATTKMGEKKTADTKKEAEEEKKTKTIDGITNRFSTLTPEQKAALKTLIETDVNNGTAPEDIQTTAYNYLLEQNGIRDTMALEAYKENLQTKTTAERTKASLETQIRAYEALSPEEKSRNPERTAQYNQHRAELLRQEAEFNSAEGQIDAITTKLGVSVDQLAVMSRMRDGIEEIVYGRQTRDGQTRGGIGGLTAQLKEHQRTLDQLKEGGTTTAEEATSEQRARLRQEAEIINDLEGALEDSINELLNSRYEELTRLATEDFKETGDKTYDGAIKRLQAKMKTNWIEDRKDTRSKEVHKENIKNGVLTLAYEGEDGLKNLIRKDIGLPMTRNLTDAEKALLDRVFEEKKNDYASKLLMDFAAARGFSDRTIFGQPIGALGLKQRELELLTEKFGALLEAGISKSKTSRDALKELKSRGIEPDSKLKWLLWILAALGGAGIVAVGAPGAAAIAMAGAAVGAKGAGGILAHGVV